jgi:hypothetical protein
MRIRLRATDTGTWSNEVPQKMHNGCFHVPPSPADTRRYARPPPPPVPGTTDVRIWLRVVRAQRAQRVRVVEWSSCEFDLDLLICVPFCVCGHEFESHQRCFRGSRRPISSCSGAARPVSPSARPVVRSMKGSCQSGGGSRPCRAGARCECAFLEGGGGGGLLGEGCVGVRPGGGRNGGKGGVSRIGPDRTLARPRVGIGRYERTRTPRARLVHGTSAGSPRIPVSVDRLKWLDRPPWANDCQRWNSLSRDA